MPTLGPNWKKWGKHIRWTALGVFFYTWLLILCYCYINRTITLFNLSPIKWSILSWSPPNDPDSLSINSQVTRNISLSVCGGNSQGYLYSNVWYLYYVSIGSSWIMGGGVDYGGIIMAGNQVLIKGCWLFVGGG